MRPKAEMKMSFFWAAFLMWGNAGGVTCTLLEDSSLNAHNIQNSIIKLYFFPIFFLSRELKTVNTQSLGFDHKTRGHEGSAPRFFAEGYGGGDCEAHELLVVCFLA